MVLWHVGEWSELGVMVRGVSPLVLIIALLLAVVSVWITGMRWYLLDPDPAGQMRRWDYFRYSMIGLTANLFMPGAVGGDAVRTAFVAKDLAGHRGVAVAAIIVDRWVGLFSLMLLGTVACAAAVGLEYRAELLAVLLVMDVAILAGWIIVRNRRVSDGLLKVVDRPGRPWRVLSSMFEAWRETILFYAGNLRRVVGALVLCVPIHLSWFLIAYLLAREVGIDSSFLALSLVTALSWVITAVPISIGGLGVRELSFVYLLSLQRIEAEPAALLGGFLSAVFVARAILGVPLFWFGRPKVA